MGTCVAWEVVDSGGVVGDEGQAWVGWWWVIFFGIEATDATEVVGTNGYQGLRLAEAGVGCPPVVMVESMLGYFIISPVGGWAVGGVPPTMTSN